jgi:hypothetical protein
VKGDIYPDKPTKEMKIGNTTIKILRTPNHERRNISRLKSLEDTIGRIYGCKCTLNVGGKKIAIIFLITNWTNSLEGIFHKALRWLHLPLNFLFVSYENYINYSNIQPSVCHFYHEALKLSNIY